MLTSEQIQSKAQEVHGRIKNISLGQAKTFVILIEEMDTKGVDSLTINSGGLILEFDRKTLEDMVYPGLGSMDQ